MSYSLYLWQQPFLNPGPASYTNRFPANLLLAFACAALSYWLVEKPLMQFGRSRRKALERALT